MWIAIQEVMSRDVDYDGHVSGSMWLICEGQLATTVLFYGHMGVVWTPSSAGTVTGSR